MRAKPDGRWLWFVALLLALPAGISIVRGATLAVNESQDFQWSGAHLFARHVDPYAQQLRHNPTGQILYTQVPNYLHELYVVLWPLGDLSPRMANAVWFVLNLGFTALVVLLLKRVYLLSRAMSLVLSLALLASVPFRAALGNGQQVFLEMALLVSALLGVWRPGLLLGLSYFKYSFSPIFFAYLLFQRRWRILLWSLVPPVAGLLIFSFWVRGSLRSTSVEPFLVARSGVWPGAGDVTTLLNVFFAIRGVVPLLLAGALSVACAFYVYLKKLPLRNALPVLTAVNLTLFPHLSYDYVLLVVPAAMLLGHIQLHDVRWLLASLSILLLWFGFPKFTESLLSLVRGLSWSVHFALLLVVVSCLVKLSDKTSLPLRGALAGTAVRPTVELPRVVV